MCNVLDQQHFVFYYGDTQFEDFCYFIFVEAKFKLTKKQKPSSDIYSLLLLDPAAAGGNSLFLL